MNKCEVKDKIVIPCGSLEKLIDSRVGEYRKRGVSIWCIRNTDSGARRELVGLNRTDEYKNGFIFNFCPVCGVQIAVEGENL